MSKRDVKIGGENDETFSHRRTSGWKNRRRTAAMLISLLSYISAIGGPLSKGPLFYICAAQQIIHSVKLLPNRQYRPNRIHFGRERCSSSHRRECRKPA
jgi:hypothetical protein